LNWKCSLVVSFLKLQSAALKFNVPRMKTDSLIGDFSRVTKPDLPVI